MAYAAAFQLLLSDDIYPIRADAAELEDKLQNKLLENKFRARAGVLLAGIFLLLMVNFFVFFSLNSSNLQLAQQVSQTTQNSSQAENISDTIKQKEMLLKELGWDGIVNKATLLDQIAQMLPRDISWESAGINPPDVAALKTQHMVNFMERRIFIRGNSPNIVSVNEWISRVRTKPWVKKIQMENYLFDNEVATGRFTVSIDY